MAPKKTLTQTVDVPAIWKRLVKLHFDEKGRPFQMKDDGEEGPPLSEERARDGERYRNGYDDEEPYRFDTRIADAVFEDGMTVEVRLCSGSENYWGEVCFGDREPEPDDTFDEFDDEYEDTIKGVEYIVKINWTE